VGVGIGKAIY